MVEVSPMLGMSLNEVSFYHRDVWGGRVSEGVKGITIEVKPGQILCIKGPNGSGKSTVIKLCMGFVEPIDGQVAKPQGARLSYIGDSGRNLYMPLNLRENIRYSFAIRNFKHSSVIDEGMRRLCSVLGLEDYAKPVASMSRGMRQKASICR
jgi:ABC-type multidrug transport system ATPase subunit